MHRWNRIIHLDLPAYVDAFGSIHEITYSMYILIFLSTEILAVLTIP